MEQYCLDIPSDKVPLLSKGLLYGEKNPLHNQHFVYYKEMTPRQENILFSSAYVKDKTVIKHLIHSCLINKEIDVDELLIGDKDALLIAIRISGYGSLYSANITCPECSTVNEHECNLSQLEISRLKINPVREYENLFEVVLPLSKWNIGFKFLTSKDERELELIGNSDAVNTEWLCKCVVSINGKIGDAASVKKAISSLRAKDSSFLKNYIKENEPKVKMASYFKCKACEHEETFPLPRNYDFFGISIADKEALFLEPMFLLGYYFGFSYGDYLHFPLSSRKWLVKRIEKEIKDSQNQNDVKAKGAHLNSPDTRALTNRSRTTVPAKLQRFT